MSREETRVITEDGTIVGTFGPEWYSGHILGVIEALSLPTGKLSVVTNAFSDDGSFIPADDSCVPWV